jgi:hypothetical protein
MRQYPVMVVSGNTGIDTKFSVYSFNTSEEAKNFCEMTSSLRQKNGGRITAKEITFGREYYFKFFVKWDLRILVDMDDRAVQKILRKAGSQVIARALKNASQDIAGKVFKNMSSRAQAMLREDMEHMGLIGLKEISDAQDKILETTMRLADTGEIVLVRSAEEEMLLGD